MERYIADTWRTARLNQHMHQALATRYARMDFTVSIALAVCGSGSVLSVVSTRGDTVAVACALACAVLLAVRPLVDLSGWAASRRVSWEAWRTVEGLCQDGADPQTIKAAERRAQRLNPASDPLGIAALCEWAYARTNQELPPERFA